MLEQPSLSCTGDEKVRAPVAAAMGRGRVTVLQRLGGNGSERPDCEDAVWRVSDRDACAGNGLSDSLLDFGTAFPLGGAVKRCFDVVLSLLLLPIVGIVVVPIACLVALNGGHAIYGHTRIGCNGRLFRCYKFRTMVVGADGELQALLEQNSTARQEWMDRFKLENDPRVTPLGRWLRRTYLDELPQIWNVLRGDMSFVGPRPVVSEEMCRYGICLPAYLACRPGITGLWQISRSCATTYGQRVAFDVDYARNWSLARDLLILLLTIPRIVLPGTESWKISSRNPA